MKKKRNWDATYVETIRVDDVIVNVYVNNQPRTEEEMNRSMERLIKARYKGKLLLN